MPVRGASRALARPDLIDTSRLAVLSALAGASHSVPLPLVPLALTRYLRGAVAYDVAARHGLSLTVDAREVFAGTGIKAKALSSGTAQMLIKAVAKKFGPLGVLAPAQASLEVLALGILFDRYLGHVRQSATIRVNATEAREVKRIIDRSVTRVLRPSRVGMEKKPKPAPPEELRDDLTRLLDTVLLSGASLPGFVVRRLEGSFDAVVAEHPELSDG
jgi:hypothetical protein